MTLPNDLPADVKPEHMKLEDASPPKVGPTEAGHMELGRRTSHASPPQELTQTEMRTNDLQPLEGLEHEEQQRKHKEPESMEPAPVTPSKELPQAEEPEVRPILSPVRHRRQTMSHFT